MATCFPTDQLSTINAVFAFSRESLSVGSRSAELATDAALPVPLPSLYTLSMIYTLSSRPSLQLPTKRVEGVALGRLDPRASRASTSFAAEGVAVQHEVVVTTEVAEVDLDGLLFRSSLARPKSERLVQPPPSLPPSDGKWQKERDCADW